MILEQGWNKLVRCGCPERHSKFKPLEESTLPEWTDLYNNFKTKGLEGGVFGLIGTRGSGKTQLATSLLGYAINAKKFPCRYVKFYDLIDDILSDSFEKKSLISPKVLVIDALEVRKNAEFSQRELTAIIDKRYDSPEKTTILVSNDTKSSFVSFIGTSIYSRMLQRGGIIEMTFKSFRGAE